MINDSGKNISRRRRNQEKQENKSLEKK